MADLIFNCAKGRFVELYNRVDLGDPSTARLFVIPIAAGAATDAALRDCDTFADIITAGATELTTGGWNRKTLAAADLVAFAPDDANDRADVDIPDQTWTAVSGSASTDVVICYASVTSPTNAQLVPLTLHDFAVTPNGGDITLQIAATGFGRAA